MYEDGPETSFEATGTISYGRKRTSNKKIVMEVHAGGAGLYITGTSIHETDGPGGKVYEREGSELELNVELSREDLLGLADAIRHEVQSQPYIAKLVREKVLLAGKIQKLEAAAKR